MITRAVFSYFNPDESFSNRAGFSNYSDFLFTMALATCLARRHFKQVQVVSTAWGIKVLKQAGIQATEYSTALDVLRDQQVSRWFWAYGKMIAYAQQTTPFVHIDNDVFLWKPLPDRVLQAELCFQSKEFLDVPEYRWYNVLKPCWDAAPVKPQIVVDNEVTDFVYNCGVCGGWNLDFFKEWIQCSAQYIFAPENQDLFFKQFKNILMHQNLYHEQYFAASLIKAHNMRSRVEVITDDVKNLVVATDRGYTHLWGATKTTQRNMQSVRVRLLREAPEVYDRVNSFVNNYLFNECPKDVRITA